MLIQLLEHCDHLGDFLNLEISTLMVRVGIIALISSVLLETVSLRIRKVLLCSRGSMRWLLVIRAEETLKKVRRVSFAPHSYFLKCPKLFAIRLILLRFYGSRHTNSRTDSYSYDYCIRGSLSYKHSMISPHLSVYSLLLNRLSLIMLLMSNPRSASFSRLILSPTSANIAL